MATKKVMDLFKCPLLMQMMTESFVSHLHRKQHSQDSWRQLHYNTKFHFAYPPPLPKVPFYAVFILGTACQTKTELLAPVFNNQIEPHEFYSHKTYNCKIWSYTGQMVLIQADQLIFVLKFLLFLFLRSISLFRQLFLSPFSPEDFYSLYPIIKFKIIVLSSTLPLRFSVCAGQSANLLKFK